MKKISFFLFIVILTALIHKTSPAQNGWALVQSSTNSWLEDVRAVDQNNIYAVGLGYTIIKSTDLGNTWSIQYSGADYYNFYSVSFINPNTGYVSGGYEQPSPPYMHTGAIFKTTTGGSSWNQIYWGSSAQITQIVALDSLKAFSCSAFSSLKTTDGGISWNAIPGLTFVTSLSFVNQNTGYATGGSSVLKTTNSGINWTSTNLGLGTLYKVLFANLNTGYILASNSLIKTTNGGINWQSAVPIPNLGTARSLFCVNPDTVFVTGDLSLYGRIFRSTDGCQTWITQYTGLTTYTMPYSISFFNNLTGFAVGPVGLILKTTTGGEGLNAVNIQNNQYPKTFELYQSYPNPFNPVTNIAFSIPTRLKVVIIVYDVSGMEIKTLVNDTKEAGNYTLQFDGAQYASGVYFYRMQAGDFTEVKKMVLLK